MRKSRKGRRIVWDEQRGSGRAITSLEINSKEVAEPGLRPHASQKAGIESHAHGLCLLQLWQIMFYYHSNHSIHTYALWAKCSTKHLLMCMTYLWGKCSCLPFTYLETWVAVRLNDMHRIIPQISSRMRIHTSNSCSQPWGHGPLCSHCLWVRTKFHSSL